MEMTTRSNRLKLNRCASLCSPNAQTQLLKALLERHSYTFQSLLLNSPIDINYVYEAPHLKTCLEIALTDPKININFVDILLRTPGIDPNKKNEAHKKAPLHFAVEQGDVSKLRRLLEHPDIDINNRVPGGTALHVLIKHIEEETNSAEKFTDCAKVLIEKKINVNIPDAKGVPPIYTAAKKGYKDIVFTILFDSKIKVDIDSYKDRTQKTARDIITKNNLYSGQLPEVTTKNLTNLFTLLYYEKEDEFTEAFENLQETDSEISNSENGQYTLLQLAANKGLEKAVRSLLSHDADANKTSSDKTLPVELACNSGYSNVLKCLLEVPDIKIPDELLHTVIKYINKPTVEPHKSYRECLNQLISDSRIDVNTKDGKGSTPLYYAARNSDHEAIMQLLRSGASVSVRNKFNEPVLADLPAQSFEAFLDECLHTNGDRCTDDTYEIIFRYSFLAPPANVPKSNKPYQSIPVDEYDSQNNKIADSYQVQNQSDDVVLTPETDALLYMSQNPELRPLVKHPVITSFLFLKWNRISWLFCTNLIFYIIFCVCLISFILFGYGYFPIDESKIQPLVNLLTTLLGICILILTTREIFQVIMSPKMYFRNYENYLEIAMIIISFIILTHETEPRTQQQLSAIAILISAAELVLLIGQHPKLSTNIVMLRTVSWNFLKFLLWYSILIVAFALSFFTLFREIDQNPDSDKNSTAPNGSNQNSDEEENFFLDPGMSLFKTIVMLTGEFEVGSIKFNTFPGTSHIIFILFIFLIAIVLFNLLNGLAVSDTQMIKNDAELVGYVSRIKLIYYFENIILGELPLLAKLRKKICLFPYYVPEEKIYVRPNQNSTIIYTHNESDDEDKKESRMKCLSCKDLSMDYKVIKSAKLIIAQRHHRTDFDEIKDSLIKTQIEISKYDDKFDKLEESLNKILNLLKNQ